MKTALLLIDIQNDYFPGGANELIGAQLAGQNAGILVKMFRKQAAPVIHIRHISTRPGSTFFLPDTPGADIHESVAPADGERIIVKHYPNSFRETELLDYLRSKGITDLVIAGMMTHMCVDATVRAAKDLGFNIILAGDACATKDLTLNGEIIPAHGIQNSFLAALAYFYATVIRTVEFRL